MGKSKMFDNIMQLIGSNIQVAGTSKQSVELDFELPRGFIAKIKKIRVDWRNVFDLVVTGDAATLEFCILLDPDDAITVALPANTVEHDVIWAGTMDLASLEAGPDNMWTVFNQEINFDQELDVISARNIRFNILVDTNEVDASNVNCQIWYTLEKIQDSLIMELLDIL